MRTVHRELRVQVLCFQPSLLLVEAVAVQVEVDTLRPEVMAVQVVAVDLVVAHKPEEQETRLL